MAIPPGAKSILFSISQYAESTEVYLQVEFPLASSTTASVDTAAQAAMNAFVASLEALNPGFPVQATRVYVCDQTGDAWPEP